MSFYGVKQVVCTLCGARFPLVSGSLNHPADLLCGECILGLYDRLPTESLDAIRVAIAARVQPRMGMLPDTLAQAIIDRVEKLPDVARSRGELEDMLR